MGALGLHTTKPKIYMREHHGTDAVLLVSITGNVFPILWPFFFLLGNPIGGKRVAALSKNNLGQTFAQTHTTCAYGGIETWD